MTAISFPSAGNWIGCFKGTIGKNTHRDREPSWVKIATTSTQPPIGVYSI